MKMISSLLAFGLLVGMLLAACTSPAPTPTPAPQRMPERPPTITPGGPPTARVRLTAIVHGKVQGVGFRSYIAREAQSLGLVGYTCKSADGTIQCVAEGERQKGEKLLELLRVGPPDATVEGVDVEWTEAVGLFDSFLEAEWCPPPGW